MQTYDPEDTVSSATEPHLSPPRSVPQHSVPAAPAPMSASVQPMVPVQAPPVALPVDAVVSTMARLVFVTTGQAACHALGEFPSQVALTPVVAFRIAEVLRAIAQHSDLQMRAAIVAEWQADEMLHVPHGRVLVEQYAVRFGIEPIGAGALVSVLWEHVPAVIRHLEDYADLLRRP